jgi:kinesin family protein 18/19
MDKTEIECDNDGKKPDVLHRSREQRYFFDRIFPQDVDTESVYANTCVDLIDSILKGYNGCVFAYGTTGSGKTHTMTGTPSTPGISYLMIQDIFARVKSDTLNNYDIKVSYVEIYNEVIRDLLVGNKKNNYLDLREDGDKVVSIAGVTEFQVKDPKQVMSLLTIGNKRRTTESTNMN